MNEFNIKFNKGSNEGENHDNKSTFNINNDKSDRYIIIKNIGNGSYGSVYLTKDNITEELFAIKKVNFNIISKKVQIMNFRYMYTIK